MTEKKAGEVLKNQLACEKEDSCDGYCDECQHNISDEDWITALNVAISALDEQDRWIPVSKDLPKKNGDYLVTCEVCGERYIEESFFCRCDDGGVFWTSQNVIAWQPRIEPYTAEEES